MYQHLISELGDGGILTVTINRPKAMNALNIQLLEELKTILEDVYDNPDIKAVLLTGSGDKAFAAGADITELQNLDEMTARGFSESGQEVFARIENCHKPILAAVNGFALGGGCELAMACHMRGASINAKFGQPEINLGIIPGYGGTQRLTQLIGKGRSIEMQLTANMIDATTAMNWGMVNFVSDSKESLMENSFKLLNKIISKAPIAAELILDSVNAVFDKGKDGFQTEANGFAKCTSTDDFKEGVSAFLEKRSAKFTGN